MNPVVFGLIGCGWIGGLHAAVIHSLDHGILSAVSDINPDAGMKLARQYHCQYYQNYQDLLKDPQIQAVAICLPTGLHAETSIQAFRHGKHVICEKPIEINLEKAKEMINAAQNGNKKLSIIMQHRFDLPVMAVKKAVSQNIFGKILWGTSRTLWYRDDAYFEHGWRGTWKYDGGGALMNQSIHYIDLLLYFLGDVKSISAKCRRILHHQIEAEDIGVANLEFQNGSIGTIEGSTSCYPGEGSQLCLFGESGSVIIKDDRLVSYSLKNGTKCPELESHSGFRPDIDPAFGMDKGSHKRQYENFVSAILNDTALLVTGEEAVKSVSVIKNIYKASDRKSEIYM